MYRKLTNRHAKRRLFHR